jgi:DNA-binding CsgD family transcriptional regulator
MTQAGYVLGRDARGLTSRERDVLVALVQGKTQIEIGPMLGISKQRVTQLVAALERKGVVKREDNGSLTVTVKSVGGKR